MSLTNRVAVTGTIMHAPMLDHTTEGGEVIYKTSIMVVRTSGVGDILVVMIPGRVLEKCKIEAMARMTLHGEIRRLMLDTLTAKGKPRWIPAIFVQRASDAEGMEDDNRVSMTGVLVDQPVYRETPFGREIAEMAVRVDRKNGRWECIRCIAWGSMARMMGCAEAGSEVQLTGRLQSRGYTKIQPDGTAKAMMTWEVSAGRVELLQGGR